MAETKILLYGRTNAGKTAQIGELSEYAYKLSNGGITRLYTADKGGIDTIQPYVDLGVIEPHVLGEGLYKGTNPWLFLSRAVQGQIKNAEGNWVLDTEMNKRVTCWAFESMRSFAEVLMSDMAARAGAGVSIGGGANISFEIADGNDKLKISGSNMAHFGVAQQRMTDEIWTSQKLPGRFLIWTSSVSKDDDTTTSGKVLGPDVIGKALTTEVPRWFNYTFRIDVTPAKGAEREKHILYLGNHVDIGAGNAAGLGNVRIPLDAPVLPKITIEPASIVSALKQLDGGASEAKKKIAARMGIKL
jgi:hypothetical protein